MTTLTSPLMHTPCTVAATERKTRNHLGLLNRLRKGRGRQQEAQSATTTVESTNIVGEDFDLDPGACSSREPDVGGGLSSSLWKAGLFMVARTFSTVLYPNPLQLFRVSLSSSFAPVIPSLNLPAALCTNKSHCFPNSLFFCFSILQPLVWIAVRCQLELSVTLTHNQVIHVQLCIVNLNFHCISITRIDLPLWQEYHSKPVGTFHNHTGQILC